MKTKIQSIRVSNLEYLIPSEKYWNKVGEMKDSFEVNKIKKHNAMQIICQNGAEMIIDVEPKITANPKSKYARFSARFGNPVEGLEVETESSDGDFPKIIFE